MNYWIYLIKSEKINWKQLIYKNGYFIKWQKWFWKKKNTNGNIEYTVNQEGVIIYGE